MNIFVFGSNRVGRHGMGAAHYALEHHGAVYGQGEGLQGRSYAIPTKDEHLRRLSLGAIRVHVDKFLEFARAHPEMTFNVTRIGCGLARYTDEVMAPLFAEAPDNCVLSNEWIAVLQRNPVNEPGEHYRDARP